MLVYVLTHRGTPVMPCRPVIARLLLKQGKARVKRRTPFTIQLTYELPAEHMQELQMGLDPGSGALGAAVTTTRGGVLYLSETAVRNDIKTKMTRRRRYRRTRRHRKCRYRPARCNNRRASRRVGRIAPTLHSKLNAHVRELHFIAKLLPITWDHLTIEKANFDLHALKDPKVVTTTWLYQQGEMYGYEHTKMYVRTRDNHTCQLCHGKSNDSRLECHHLISRKDGGTDMPANLITLCSTCHDQVHEGTKRLSSRTVRDSIARNIHATQMNVLRSQLFKLFPSAQETLGCITKIDREALGLPKTHYLDAVAIACHGRPVTFAQTVVLIKTCVAGGAYQQRKGKRSEKPLTRGKIQGLRTYDQVRYRGQIYFLKGRMSSGYGVLMDIRGTKQPLKSVPKLAEMVRLSARRSCLMVTEPLPAETSSLREKQRKKRLPIHPPLKEGVFSAISDKF